MAGLVIRDLTPEGASESIQALTRGAVATVAVAAGHEHVKTIAVRAYRHEVVDVDITTTAGTASHVVDEASRSPQQRHQGRENDGYGELVFAINAEEVLEATLR